MRLHLLRHGQSTWNVEHRLQGQSPGVPLTDLGREQAGAAAEQLVGFTGAIWSSDLLRAQQTAEVVAARLGLEIRYDIRLREQCYGRLEGRLTTELEAEQVPDGSHITEIAWGNGESLEKVYLRVRDFLLGLPDEEAVLVTHGDTLRVALTVVDQLNRGEPDAKPHRLVSFPIVPNGSLTRVELVANSLRGQQISRSEQGTAESAPRPLRSARQLS